MLLPPFCFPCCSRFTLNKVLLSVGISNIFLSFIFINKYLVKLLFKFILIPSATEFEWEIATRSHEVVSLLAFFLNEFSDVLTVSQELFGIYQGTC